MKTLILIVVGVVGGIIGGMGMGGGTFLIPLLTVFCGVEQHIAQSVNLIAFVPMSIVAIIIHCKNKLIDFKVVPYIVVPAVVLSIPSAILAKKLGAKALSVYFGVFLILLGVYQLVVAIKRVVNEVKKRATTGRSRQGE